MLSIASLWKVRVDNPIGESVPHFAGEHRVLSNLNEEVEAADCFEALITFEILVKRVRNSNCYAMRKMAMRFVLPLLSSTFILVIYW